MLYGSGTGLQATTPPDQFWNQDSPNVKEKAEPGDNFGRSLRTTAGDFNHDGYDDLVATVIGENVNGHPGAGAANMLYGAAAGIQAESPDDQFGNQDSPSVKDVAEDNDQFGSPVG